MAGRGYKKYMKKDIKTGNPFIKIFIVSFFGMLLLFTLLFNYISKVVTVDTSIGEYKEQQIDDMEDKKIVDMNRLEMIQNEDQGRNFTDIIKEAEKTNNTELTEDTATTTDTVTQNKPAKTEEKEENHNITPDTVYKVFIGNYTSSEQAKVAKEIIQESGSGLNPIVKCIGTNDYTLQVGIFKNKQSAEAMLTSIKNNKLPGRIIQE